ncbi:hypothetical protein [Singulisphaera acidiphila]|uniref:hypothetical protein n=2 Tax=Singulisphaera acidiphila TaxID=466153 RepID=UPI001FD62521|nr:hypothetical protein [Singulisphaera acidiphila]
MDSLAELKGLPTPAIEVHHLASVRDLGDLPPAASTAPIKATAWIAPSESVTFRFEATFAADYILFFRYLGDRVALSARTPGGTVEIPHGPAGPFSAVPLSLAPGEYFVTALAEGQESIFVDWDLVLSNGVGQDTAVNLAVADTTATLAAPARAIAPNPSPASPIGSVSSVHADETPESPVLAAPPSLGQGLTLGLGGTLIGRPVPDAQRVPAVGPGVRGGTVALASVGEDLLTGINYGRAAPEQNNGPAAPQPENEGTAVPEAPGWMEHVAMRVASWATPTSGEEPAAGRFGLPAERDRPAALASEETSEAEAGPWPASPIPIVGLGLVGLALIGQRQRRNSQRRSGGLRPPVSRKSTRLQIW